MGGLTKAEEEKEGLRILLDLRRYFEERGVKLGPIDFNRYISKDLTEDEAYEVGMDGLAYLHGKEPEWLADFAKLGYFQRYPRLTSDILRQLLRSEMMDALAAGKAEAEVKRRNSSSSSSKSSAKLPPLRRSGNIQRIIGVGSLADATFARLLDLLAKEDYADAIERMRRGSGRPLEMIDHLIRELTMLQAEMQRLRPMTTRNERADTSSGLLPKHPSYDQSDNAIANWLKELRGERLFMSSTTTSPTRRSQVIDEDLL